MKRLLLVHGHWSQYRLTHTMLFFYNKCTLFLTVQLWTIISAGFSAITWYDTLYFVIYNLTMTSVVYTVYGFFEKHLTDTELLDHPWLYGKIAGHRNLRPIKVVLYLLDGFWQGTVIFTLTYYVFSGGEFYAPAKYFQQVDRHLQEFDFNMIGAASYLVIVICANLRITIYVRDFNVFYLVALLCTVILNVIVLILFQTFAKPTGYHAAIYKNLVSSPTFWFSIPVIVFLAELPALLWRIASDYWWRKQLVKDGQSRELVVTDYLSTQEIHSLQMVTF
ncbi:unnamed protein product [Echinostoma caproni]|uniref:P-type ATPase C-terminal domain-containing protein n=1 Tax=Echinostoma caproni TaxID=27848 RepID=A0A3P8HLZ1_9TREM|nr:unnamed protein product [Echinostoma caproni]